MVAVRRDNGSAGEVVSNGGEAMDACRSDRMGLMSIRLRLSEYVALSSALAAAVACLAMAPPSSAGTGVVDVFGGPGNDAGSFDFPGGMAVNEATGDVYVADVHNNDGGNRIQQFTADGDFIRAWGWGVATGANVLEVCTASCLPGIAGSGEGQLSLSSLIPPEMRRSRSTRATAPYISPTR